MDVKTEKNGYRTEQHVSDIDGKSKTNMER